MTPTLELTGRCLRCAVNGMNLLPVEAQHIGGIDVSPWRRDINWEAMKSMGVQFAFPKANDDVNLVDGRLAQNVTGASTGGICIGTHHFAGN
jgi:lysozyme